MDQSSPKADDEPEPFQGRLKRLDPDSYRGHAWVHWSMTVDGRKTGWLSDSFHQNIREALLHTLSRYHLICPAYCLMPDHGHFLLGGLKQRSDQRLAIPFFRKEWNRQFRLLHKSYRLQKQAHDHVLRRKEWADPASFQTVAEYILNNPVKAELVEQFEDWRYLGSIVAGYPNLNPRDLDYWERFWKICHLLREEDGITSGDLE